MYLLTTAISISPEANWHPNAGMRQKRERKGRRQMCRESASSRQHRPRYDCIRRAVTEYQNAEATRGTEAIKGYCSPRCSGYRGDIACHVMNCVCRGWLR